MKAVLIATFLFLIIAISGTDGNAEDRHEESKEFYKEVIENQKRIMQFQEDCKAGNYPAEVC